ncbi:mannose-1-phosphate guanyltransferase [Pseudoalteromonas luteoviolacea]|nr:mannose-1-phosphate guanyltransferase [Pseudoalteromonas luteoviolacea]
MVLPVILAGGSGTRLWPLSRGNYPKQFLRLCGEQTMLQQTLQRLRGLKHSAPLLICNEAHRFIAAEQLREVGISNSGIFLEPVGRNTAPAIALAALKSIDDDCDPILLVLAADHVIGNQGAFRQSVEAALPLAVSGQLVTFGIVGDRPETGYGYIKRGKSVYANAYQVAEFVEKPDFETANKYIESGAYYWNSGMFMFKASTYLKELQAHRPDIYEACVAALQSSKADIDFIRVDRAAFESCPSESVDYAVMEHTKQAVVVPMDAQWSDVGGFSSLWDVQHKDANGNVFVGDVKSVNSKNTLAYAENKLVAAVGVEDLVIINTKDAILVANKRNAQDVKLIVNELTAQKRWEVTSHREVYRPWGKYDLIDSGERFQVKRITVRSGAKLSLQMHHHRAEHWIVVSGTAKVRIGDKSRFVTENESVYIPIAEIHALENPGKVDLELIEVQSGTYLEEDDIVRFEDRYGRVR